MTGSPLLDAAGRRRSPATATLPLFASGCSEPESGGGGHHRCAPGVDGGNDLLGVDALQGRSRSCRDWRGELALDHVERHALARATYSRL
jgi:hypothetical protein